jgi:hypothetical protein
MRVIRLVSLAAIAVLAGPLTSASGLAQRAPGQAAATVTHRVDPVTATGIAPGFRVVQRHHGDCWTGSEAVDGTHRCMYGDTRDERISDPCWADPADPTDRDVVCPVNPWSKRLIEIRSKHRLTRFANHPIQRALPWGLTLSNGWRCTLFEGAHDSFRSRVVDWSCGYVRSGHYHYQGGVLRHLDQHGRPWTCAIAIYHRHHNHYTSGGTVTITNAWYGITRRSSSGRDVIFDSDGSLFAVSAGGGKATLIPSGNGFAQQAAWNSKGTAYAFTRQSSTGHLQIFVKKSVGGSVRQVTFGRHDDYDPTWSGSGHRIAFARGLTAPEVCVLTLSSKKVIVLRKGGAPAWSPVADAIAYRVQRGAKTDIQIMNRHGKAESGVLQHRLVGDTPSWNPSGARLAFSRIVTRSGAAADKQKAVIDVLDLKSSTVTRLASGHEGEEDSSPSWSPNGRALVFGRLSCRPDGECTAVVLLLPHVGAGSSATPHQIAVGSNPSWF